MGRLNEKDQIPDLISNFYLFEWGNVKLGSWGFDLLWFRKFVLHLGKQGMIYGPLFSKELLGLLVWRPERGLK